MIRRGYDAWNRGDLDAVASFVHPRVVLELRPERITVDGERVRIAHALSFSEGAVHRWRTYFDPEAAA